MKIECTQENLQRALSITSRMVGVRSTLPVLANVLLKTKGGRLRLSATNLEVGISTYVGGRVSGEGDITLPAKLLAEFVATNQDKTVTIETKEETAYLKSAHYNAEIKGIAASEFPAIPEITSEFEAEVAAGQLRQAITQTVFAAAIEETRPVLAGVLLRIKDSSFKLVATDSFRLTEKILKLDKGASRATDVIIPARTMVEVARLLESDTETANLRLGENQAAFTIGDTYLISRIVEGAFPDYEQIIPEKIPTESTVDRHELINAMKMSSLFARDAGNNIKIRVTPKQLEIIATSPQLGENRAVVAAEGQGEGLEIAFNARYILDALLVMEAPKVTMGFAGKLSASVIRDTKDPTFKYIVMPLRMET